jgi:hypothetical protein
LLDLIPRKYGTRNELDVADLESREGDEDEDLDPYGFGDEEVGNDDERKREEEDEAAEEATGFDSDEHEVGEGATGDEQSAIEIGRNRLVGGTRALRYGREVSALLRRRHG